MTFRVEAISVCHLYSDFLSICAEYNRQHFDRWVVVTTDQDVATREVCRRFNLDTVVTEDEARPGETFAKGRLIEKGLRQLSAKSWRWHIDADILLPSHTRQALEAAHLDESCIYGIDRVMVRGWDEWVKLRDSGYLRKQWQWHSQVTFPEGYPVGARWSAPREGWVPIGFSQLWNGKADEFHGIRSRSYAEFHGDACRSDVQFGLLFDRRKRSLLPEIIAVHLESEKAKTGANWAGRTTAPFGPPGKKDMAPRGGY